MRQVHACALDQEAATPGPRPKQERCGPEKQAVPVEMHTSIGAGPWASEGVGAPASS